MINVSRAIETEMRDGEQTHGAYHSMHEAYAVLLEEVDELWECVRQKRADRDRLAMWRECIQVAAVAARIARQIDEGSL